MLLAELRPASILEFGSGNGSSALWMADIAQLHEFPCHIVSIDKTQVTETHPQITFVTADIGDLDAALSGYAKTEAPRLVIEDAHVHVSDVLARADRNLAEGDYLIIEDSVGKSREISDFLSERPGQYEVDTFYTDFFGRNATSCVDSILRKMK